MHPPPSEVLWLDSRETVSVAELCRVCGVSADELDELVEYGALEPVHSDEQGRMFSAVCVVPLRKVCRLRIDFDLDVFTAAVLLGYLHRIDELERQVRSLQAAGSARYSQSETEHEVAVEQQHHGALELP